MTAATATAAPATLRQRLEAELAEAALAVQPAQAALDAAVAAQTDAQREVTALAERFRPLTRQLEARGDRLAPFLESERDAVDARLKKAKVAVANVTATLSAAQRRLEQARKAGAQLAMVGE